MKFNKTILAVAIAGLAAAPVAQADVTLSGYIGIILLGTDADAPAVGVDADGNPVADESELRFVSDDSTLNVAASHDLNSGLTGYGHWRLDAGLANDNVASADNIHVGIKGGFGDVRVGEVPDALEYGQVANDALWDIGGEERGVSYTGSFGPATVGVNWSPVGTLNGAKAGGGSDKIAAGIKFGVGGFSIGLGAGDVNENSAFSAGASFGVAGFSVGVAFKSMESFSGGLDRETVGATLGYGVGNFTGKLTYEADQGDFNDGDNLIRVDLGYGLGGGMDISTRINSFTDDSDSNGDNSNYRLMITKSF